MRDKLRSTIVVLTLATFVAGCAGYHPSGEAKRAQRPPASGYRTVVSGDTLYSIATTNGVEPRDLAALNGINDPSGLRVGQVDEAQARRLHKAQRAALALGRRSARVEQREAVLGLDTEQPLSHRHWPPR